MKLRSKNGPKLAIPDLPTQYEELLDTIWRREVRERLEDRIEGLDAESGAAEQAMPRRPLTGSALMTRRASRPELRR